LEPLLAKLLNQRKSRPPEDSDEEQPLGDGGFRVGDGRKTYPTVAAAVADMLDGDGLLSEEQPVARGVSRRAAPDGAARAGDSEDSDGLEEPADEREPSHPEDDDASDDESDEGTREQSDEDQAEGQPDEDEDEDRPSRDRVPEGFEVELAPGQKVTIKELREGYLRHKDYTQKSQEAAEIRKHALETRQYSDQVRTEYASKLDLINRALFSVYEERPQEYWEQLRQRDVSRYMLEKEGEREQREKMNAIVGEHQAEVQRFHAEAQRRHAERLVESRKVLAQEVPAWADPNKLQQGTQRLRNKAVEYYGFPSSDLDGIVDHRVVLVLRDAIRYREAMQKGTSPAKTAAQPRQTVSRPVPFVSQKRGNGLDQKKALKKFANSEGHFANPEAAVNFLLSRDKRHEE
jgi:hypothetical protein